MSAVLTDLTNEQQKEINNLLEVQQLEKQTQKSIQDKPTVF